MLVQCGSLEVELADFQSLAVEVGIVAVEPVDAAVWLQVGIVQDALDGGAGHGFLGVAIGEDGGQVVKAPLTGDAVVLAGFAGGQVDDFELFFGGKSSWVDRSVEHLANRPGRP